MWMWEGKVRHDWDQTSALLALVANRTNFGGGRPAKVEDFHPLPRPKARRQPMVTMSVGEVLPLLFPAEGR